MPLKVHNKNWDSMLAQTKGSNAKHFNCSSVCVCAPSTPRALASRACSISLGADFIWPFCLCQHDVILGPARLSKEFISNCSWCS